MKRYDIAVALFLAFVLCGCAHWPLNPKLDRWDKGGGYRFKNARSSGNTESLFVILAFSGGGTRAAALSYGALKHLRETQIYWKGETKSLLSEVDVISSVSGGSFTALYYGVHGDQLFDEFEEKFLYAPIQKRLSQRVLLPWNWFRLASPHFDRIDLAAELYRADVFGDATYGALIDSGRSPYIIANATDITSGARFEFTQDQFDMICSDLREFPVARAAAASSAFPGLLSPLTLKSYGRSCGTPVPGWVGEATRSREDNPFRYETARMVERYFEPDKRFVHLIDGGVADNIGMRGPLHALLSNDAPWSLVDMINNGKIERLLFIAVNAKTVAAKKWDSRENAPGIVKVLKTSGTTPMAHYSFETVERIRKEGKSENLWQETVVACKKILHDKCPQAELPFPPPHRVYYHSVEVNFKMLPDESHRRFFQGLPTTFQLEAPVVDCLQGVAGSVIAESGNFNAFLDELDQLARADGVEPPNRAPAPGYSWPCGGN